MHLLHVCMRLACWCTEFHCISCASKNQSILWYQTWKPRWQEVIISHANRPPALAHPPPHGQRSVTHRSTWGSLQSARTSGPGRPPAAPAGCAASRLGRTQTRCPLGGCSWADPPTAGSRSPAPAAPSTGLRWGTESSLVQISNSSSLKIILVMYPTMHCVHTNTGIGNRVAVKTKTLYFKEKQSKMKTTNFKFVSKSNSNNSFQQGIFY